LDERDKLNLVKEYRWNDDKNQLLQQERGISFEDVVQAISDGSLIDDIKNPNSEQYPNQLTFIIEIRGYIYCVPYIESDSIIFLKTIFPSRKMKKRYLGD
jgi:uncharacterized DUF497 family protein